MHGSNAAITDRDIARPVLELSDDCYARRLDKDRSNDALRVAVVIVVVVGSVPCLDAGEAALIKVSLLNSACRQEVATFKVHFLARGSTRTEDLCALTVQSAASLVTKVKSIVIAEYGVVSIGLAQHNSRPVDNVEIFIVATGERCGDSNC